MNRPDLDRSMGALAHTPGRPAAEAESPATFPVTDPILKRPMDLVLSVAGLLTSLPLWAGIAVAIWLEDGWPVFFRQERIGRYGRPIHVLKFRSMVRDHAATEVQARANDPRLTQVGRFLRRFSLDELPQLWSIARGEMSFVGPRAQPEREIVRVGGQEVQTVMRQLPGFALRQLAQPGLTGIAQLYAPREILHRQKFRYDMIYVRRLLRSHALKTGSQSPALSRMFQALAYDLRLLGLDLALILRSLGVAMRGRWEV